LIGIFSTTVNELKSSPGMTFEVINPKKIKKKGYQNSGTVREISNIQPINCSSNNNNNNNNVNLIIIIHLIILGRQIHMSQL